MNSIKCPTCSLANWSSDEICKRCKQPLRIEPQFQQSYSTTPVAMPVYSGQPYAGYSPLQLRTGIALTSMVLGIVSLPTSFFLIGLLLAPIGFVLGIIGIVKANKQPHVFGGKGFAIAGIATSACSFFLIVPIIAAIAIPNLLAARKAANEGSAISSLNTLYNAELTYMATTGQGRCGDLNALVNSNFIRSEFADGEKNGYKFSVKNGYGQAICEVHAVPSSSSSGKRSFMISSSEGSVHAADKNGRNADLTDPLLPVTNLRHQTASADF